MGRGRGKSSFTPIKRAGGTTSIGHAERGGGGYNKFM